MNIKSLLLGSAAALVAVSGARAADAVMAPEPEPVEYVRVCDAYGAGFFYIPGTETCLQISGYVRYEIRASEVNGVGTAGTNPWFATEGWRKHVEARVNFDARTETEWGTLRSYIRFQASDYQGSGSADLAVGLDQAYIQLAGFTMGYTESYFVDGFSPVGTYGSHSMNGGPGYSMSGGYGYAQRALIAYNFNSNGFFGAISLEDDASDNYVPDVVLKAGYAAGWGGVYGVVGIDEDNNNAAVGGDTEFALRGGVQINVPNSPGSNLRVFGFYASGTNAYWDQAEWSVAASYQHQFSPMFFAHVGARYWSDIAFVNGRDGWGAEAGVGVNLSPNFQVRGEVIYTDWEGVNNNDGVVSGRMRFIRTF